MDTAIIQAINTLVLAIKVIVCSLVKSAMVLKAMIAKTSALARKQPFLFSIIPQTVAKILAEHLKMRMIMNTTAIVEKGKAQYSITINATPMSCQEI
jgi:hypothetical protein